MAVGTGTAILIGAGVSAAATGASAIAAHQNKPSTPKLPSQADASKIAAKQALARRRSAESFIARQQFIGPTQLQAPGILF